MKNKQNVPQVRFKEFTDAWEQRKLGEICEYHTSSLTAKDVNENGNYDLYDANSLIGKTNKGCMEEDYITIIKDGAGVGRTRLLPKNSMFLGTMGALTPRNSDLDFLFQLITNADLGKTYTGSTIPHIYFKDYGKNRYSIPSCSEQHQIGSYFRNLDHLITLHQRKCETLQKLKKSMLQKMFPKNGSLYPEIRFAGFTDAWEQRELGEMGSTYTGLSGKTKEDFGHGEAKFITYMNVFSNPVADLQMTESVEIDSKQNCVKAGDVFFTTSSETPEEVGMSCVMPESADNIYLNSFCFGYRPTEKFDLNYLAYVLRAESFRKEMTFLAQGISRYNISKNKVMEVEIPVPSLDEQSKVGQYFSNLDNLITLHQRKPKKLIMYSNHNTQLKRKLQLADGIDL